MLDKLRVGQKVFLIEALVVVALVLLLVFSFSFFSRLHDALVGVRDEGMPNALVAKDMQMQVVQVQQWLTDISATRGLDGLDDGYAEAEKAYRSFAADLAQIRQAYLAERDDAGVRAADTLKVRMDAWYAVGKRMAAAYVAGGPESGNKVMAEFDTVSTQLQEALQPVIDGQLADARQDLSDSLAQAGQVRLWTLTGILIVTAISLAGGVWLTRSVVVRLSRLSTLMHGMVRSKDLSATVAIAGGDEIASAGQAFNELVATLRAMLRELNENVVRLDATAGSLAGAVGQAAGSAEASSESASSMAAATEQLSVSLDQMRSNAEATLGVVREASRDSAEGGAVIDRAVAEMQQISRSVLEVSSTIAQLGEQTRGISNIVEVIREVADQTNLLALNAAIEAARAGEAGRGFAVVADEVRKLAERTSQSTAEISAMIQAIQGSSGQAVGVMEQAVGQANRGAGLASEAGQAIGRIRAGTADVERVFGEITLAIAEQSSAGQLIAGKVEAVAQAAEASLGATRQSQQVANALGAMANDIRGLAAGFRT